MYAKNSLKRDEKAVSPVIAVIMMIAITVVIAAVVAAFAYGIIGGVKKAPSAALIVEGAISSTSSTNVKIIHHGGDKIVDAFTNQSAPEFWHKLQVRHNGEPFGDTVTLNGVAATAIDDHTYFQAGDELILTFTNLTSGDSIAIVYTETGDLLQRITVT